MPESDNALAGTRDSSATAQDIYQRHLDLVSDLLLAGEAEGCTANFALPMLIRTNRQDILFETESDVLDDTRHHCDSLKGNGVTEYIRICKKARRVTDTLVEGYHETYILRHAKPLLPSYLSRMVLTLEDGVWKVREAEHELDASRFPMRAVRPQPGIFADKWDNEISDVRATGADPASEYQVFLDSLTSAVNAADFTAYCKHFTVPCSAHYDDSDAFYDTPSETRPFFDYLIARMAELGADNIRRSTDRASFVSADRIVGYHTTDLMRGDESRFGPVRSRMVLHRQNGRWKCQSVTNSLSQIDASNLDFALSDILPTLRDIDKRTPK